MVIFDLLELQLKVHFVVFVSLALFPHSCELFALNVRDLSFLLQLVALVLELFDSLLLLFGYLFKLQQLLVTNRIYRLPHLLIFEGMNLLLHLDQSV